MHKVQNNNADICDMYNHCQRRRPRNRIQRYKPSSTLHRTTIYTTLLLLLIFSTCTSVSALSIDINDTKNDEESNLLSSSAVISRLLKKDNEPFKKMGKDIAHVENRAVNKKKIVSRAAGGGMTKKKTNKALSNLHIVDKIKQLEKKKDKHVSMNERKEEGKWVGKHNNNNKHWVSSWTSKSSKRSKKSKGSKGGGGWGDDCVCVKKWGDEWYGGKSGKSKVSKGWKDNHKCKKWKCNNDEHDDDWYWGGPTKEPTWRSWKKPSYSPSHSPTVSAIHMYNVFFCISIVSI